MLAHPTSDRLIALGLSGMARALDDQRRTPACEVMTFEERLGLLVDREAAERDTRRLATRLKFAALRHAASVEDADLRTPRGLDRAVFAHLADGGWIGRAENLLITGATGLGKAVDAFHRLLRSGDAAGPDLWIKTALESPVASFAKGIVADKAAVAAAIELPWSNRQTEGHICRLKTLKRQMGDRANLELLRARLMVIK